ncbi:MAG: hypothetical protein J6J61_00580, partial [Muribaculaceae bacterium]|nr:hypothetical protein [Muribaculaceae bacterium]
MTNAGGSIGGAKTFDVYKVELPDGVLFPSSLSQQDYVDKYYEATDATSLAAAFANILSEIELQAAYKPTLIDPDAGESLSGYVEIYDNLSEFMEVKGVEGILSDGVLHTGSNFCRHLNENDFGHVSNPTDLGNEFIWAVQERLGLTTAQARDVVSRAFTAGQLAAYDEETDEYSNYIGWWADENKNFKGHWDGSSMAPPEDEHGNPIARYAVKSYGVLGEGVVGMSDDSEMLYSYIDVCLDVTGGSGGEHKGETKVIWGVPSSLLPLVKYSAEVTTDLAEGIDAKVTIIDAAPIRLLYEVGLRSEYADPDTIATAMQGRSDDTAFRVETDGRYTFFANEWKQASSADPTPPGYSDDPISHTNATAYFEPSRENERYYFNEDSPVYVGKVDGSGNLIVNTLELYIGANKPTSSALSSDERFFRKHLMFSWTSDPSAATVVAHHAVISDASLAAAEDPEEDGTWMIPKETILRTVDAYTLEKQANLTGTLKYSDYPAIGTRKINGIDHLFAVEALGNNGLVSIAPSTGIVLSKEVDGVADTDSQFVFTITSSDASYSENGFTNGVQSVTLKAGESASILGIPAGTYTIEETGIPSQYYEYVSVSGSPSNAIHDAVPSDPKVEVKVNSGITVLVKYTNKTIDHRDIILTKKVTGVDASKLPDGQKTFTFKVSLNYSEVDGEIDNDYTTSKLTASPITPITVDDIDFEGNGKNKDAVYSFTIAIGADETVLI